ncbi:DUF7144 family membrane protein [Acrocarpospora catenulata]|uniref:DUF7144 family membrane protein n=1 Tax=Acrocarpospora catenulata TaxID=2836182 RepID=UPI001BDA3507|nr:hypothetical protein [Acrocarpospora catenulata]
MTTASPGRMPSTTHERVPSPPPTSNWLGFAGIIGITVGVFNIIGGFVALFRSSYFLVGTERILVFNFFAWGVIWLVIGVIQVVTGFGIIAGKTWARAVGIIMALLAMLGQFAFMAAYPVWSIVDIVFCLFIIYALVVPPRGSVA